MVKRSHDENVKVPGRRRTPQTSGKPLGKEPGSTGTQEALRPSCVSDDEYWEEMLGISKGPTGWNFSCG